LIWLWGDGFDSVRTLISGAALIDVGSTWKTVWAKSVEQLRGEGRLEWQSSELGTHSMFWHNRMSGGSAGDLGIVQEFKIGVPVLTNAAKPVDVIGAQTLSELVKLKENELRE
jgi:hypothetical protein